MAATDQREYVVRVRDREYRARVDAEGRVWLDGQPEPIVVAPAAGRSSYRVPVGGRTVEAIVRDEAGTRWIFVEGRVYEAEVRRAGARRRAVTPHHELTAPMPATVLRVLTAPGQHVRGGDTLLLLEAMKMELPVRAPRDATIASVSCREGELVQAGAVLIELD